MTITEADSNMLKVTSNAFKDGQYMPVDYTGFEIPDEFVNQGEPYPRSKCKPIIDLPPEQFDRVLAIYKELPDDLLEHLIRGEEQEDA